MKENTVNSDNQIINEYLVSGYLSVIAAIDAGKRDIKTVYIDAQRKDKAFASKFKQAEKYQYNKLFALTKKRGIKVENCSSKRFSEICPEKNSGGIAATVGVRRYETLDKLLDRKGLLVYIEGIEDPYNFGQLLRTFYASGVDGVITSGRSFYGAESVIIRASAGASERLAVSVCADTDSLCDELKQRNIPIYVTGQTADSVGLYEAEYALPLCLCIGGERRGLTKKMISSADKMIEIKYPKKTDISLSASSAAAIIAYHVSNSINKDRK